MEHIVPFILEVALELLQWSIHLYIIEILSPVVSTLMGKVNFGLLLFVFAGTTVLPSLSSSWCAAILAGDFLKFR